MPGQPGGVDGLPDGDQLCSSLFKIAEGGPDNLIDRLIDRLGSEEALQHADTFSPHPVRIQEGEVALRLTAHTPGGLGVRMVIARDHVQRPDGVLHRAADGAGGVLGHAVWHDAIPADQPQGGPDAYQAVGGGGAADGVDGVGADANEAHIGGNGCPGASRGTAWRPGQVVGISGLPQDGADCLPPDGELMQIGLGQDQGSGLAQAFGEESILPGDKAL